MTKLSCHVSPTREGTVIIGQGGRDCDCCLVAVCAHCNCVLHIDQKVCKTHLNISNNSSQQLFKDSSPYVPLHYIEICMRHFFLLVCFSSMLRTV